MQLHAVVTLADFEALLRQATPLRIAMRDDARRWVELEQPTEVTFVPGRGVRVVTQGRLELDVVDVRVPAKIKELRLMLSPALVPPAQLVFKLAVERLDVSHVPGLIEEALLPAVNTALAPLAARLAWNFGKTLHASLRVPPRIQPLDRLELGVDGAEIEIDSERVAFRVNLVTSLTRS